MGSVGQNSTFTEHGHVAYQIKENHDCSNIVANILPADPLSAPPPSADPVVRVNRSKFNFFRTWSRAYQIKENHACSYMVANIPPPPIPILGLGSVGQNTTFSEHGCVAYQIKENHECSNMVANICPQTPIPDAGDGVNRSKFFFFSEHGHVACCFIRDSL